METLKYIAIIGIIFGFLNLGSYIYNIYKSIRYKQPYTIYDSLSLFKEDEFKDRWRIGVILFLILSLFAIVFTNAAVQETIGIDDIELKPSGTYCYYVKIENNKYEYVLPGQIEKFDGNYYIEKVYFSNGGYLYFNDFDVELGISATESDQNGNEWTCTLTNERAYSPNIEETSHVSTKAICFLAFKLASVVFAIVCLICKKYKSEK